MTSSWMMLVVAGLAVCVLAGLKSPDDVLVSKGEQKEKCSADDQKQCAALEERNCWDGYVCCEEWGRRNQCELNKDWMKKNCKVTCKACKKDGDYTGCKDFYPDCPKWAGEGECKKNLEWMDNNCRESCKACDQLKPDSIKKNCKI